MDEPTVRPREDGFELAGTLYPWHVSDVGKDLMLIDRITGLPMGEFFDLIEDADQRGRTPILLALIATSIRHRNPDWTVERIYRLVMNMSLGDVEIVNAESEQEEEGMLPPSESSLTPLPAGEGSKSPSNGSSLSSIPAESSISETSYASPV